MSDTSDQNSQATAPTEQTSPAIPEGVPAAFWDGEKNELKTADLIADYANLSKFKSETDAKYASRPESVDKYALPDVATLELPEGVSFEFDAENPLLATAREAAFAAGLDQKGFEEKFIKPYVATQLASLQKAEEEYQAEMAKLGEKGQARIEAINTYLQSALPADQFEALSSAAVNSKAVEALEALISKTKDATMKGSAQGAGNVQITQEELTKLQSDPSYWRDHDPAIVQKVQDGYKKLYPNQIPTSH